MEQQEIISLQQFCTHYNIPVTFIQTLQEFELVEVIVEQELPCIHITQIKNIEKMIRLHYELNINFEGLDVINHLLTKIESLQHEVHTLNHQLSLHDAMH